jgi:hypothetical protein
VRSLAVVAGVGAMAGAVRRAGYGQLPKAVEKDRL